MCSRRRPRGFARSLKQGLASPGQEQLSAPSAPRHPGVPGCALSPPAARTPPPGTKRLPKAAGAFLCKAKRREGKYSRDCAEGRINLLCPCKKKKERCGRKSNTSSPPPPASPWPHVRAHAEEGRGQLLALAAEGRRQQRGSELAGEPAGPAPELAGDGERGVSDFSPPGTSCSPDDR